MLIPISECERKLAVYEKKKNSRSKYSLWCHLDKLTQTKLGYDIGLWAVMKVNICEASCWK